jgi:hypothetical protein
MIARRLKAGRLMLAGITLTQAHGRIKYRPSGGLSGRN